MSTRKTLAMSGRASATARAGRGDRQAAAEHSGVARSRSRAPIARPTRSAFNLAGRYSSKMYTTLDNADVNYNTYQGFGEWFVMDTRANYRVNRHWSAGVGVDNLLNRKYFLFHPFPQRTFVANLKYSL